MLKMIIDVHDGQSIKPPACCDQKERVEYRYWFIYLSFLVLEKSNCVCLSFHHSQTVHVLSLCMYSYCLLTNNFHRHNSVYLPLVGYIVGEERGFKKSTKSES